MTWIQTYTGVAFDLLNPRPEMVRLEDIAHALSMQCRYNGHAREFYSVAEHSIHVSSALVLEGSEVMAQGLLHDACEAYIGDLVSAIKRMPSFSAFEDLERAIWIDAIAPRFRLPEVLSHHVTMADRRMLATEVPQVLGPETKPWLLNAPPFVGVRLDFLGPKAARYAFLGAAERLGIE